MLRISKKLLGFIVGVFFSGTLVGTPITIISADRISNTTFTISERGLYVLGDNVNFARTNGTAITISSSDVILDLNGKVLINTGAGSETGISISASTTNVTIKNGSLMAFDSNIITVAAGCSDLYFDSLDLIGARTAVGNAFNFAGTVNSATRTVNVYIENCSATNCLRGLSATATDKVWINNSTFNLNGQNGILANDTNGWEFYYSQASFNVAAANPVTGLSATSAGCWRIKNSDFSGNNALSSQGKGLTFISGAINSGGHEIENCMFCDNKGGLLVAGADFASTNSCLIKNCRFNGNVSSTQFVGGLRLTGSAIVVENCIFDGNFNLSGAAGVFGCEIGSGTGHQIINCQAINNVSFGGPGVGINVTGTGHVIDDCVVTCNRGVGASNSVGVKLLNGFHCLVRNSIAIANPTTGFLTSGSAAGDNLFIGNISFGSTTNFGSTIPFLTIAATGPYPAAPTFDERNLANISFT